MHHLKRIGWLFLAGFVTAAGGATAIFVAFWLSQLAQGERLFGREPDPRNYQPPKPGDISLVDVKLSRLTASGGVVGIIENHTKRKIRSFNADLSLAKNGAVLHRCRETVSVTVESGKSAPFSLLCRELEQSKMTDDIEAQVTFNWIYPSLDE